MIILGIETSGPSGGVAVLSGGVTVAERDLAHGLMHGRDLVPALAAALDDAGLTADAIDLVAVNRGPGSHTGLRIGLIAAKTLAWSLHLPLAGIDAVEALCAQVPASTRAVVPAIDARLGRIFGGVRVDGEWVLPAARHDAATLLAAAPAGAVVVGSGTSALAELLTTRPDLTRAAANHHEVHATTVARIAWERPGLGRDAHAVEAVYFS